MKSQSPKIHEQLLRQLRALAKSARASLASGANLGRRFLNYVGRHPVAAGAFGLLGLVGLAISIRGFILDRRESRETTEQVVGVQAEVQQIAEDLRGPCSSPPCWTTREFLTSSFIGTPQELVERKLPAPFRKDKKQYLYEVLGCRVNIEFQDGAVTYFEALVGQDEEDKCDFQWNSNYWLRGSRIARNSKILVGDIVRPLSLGGYPPLRMASACIDCGNYSDPFLELVIPGSHAGGFIDFYLTTFYEVQGEDGLDYYDRPFVQMKETFRQLGGDSNIDTQDHCDRDMLKIVGKFGLNMRVERLGMGRGRRAWSNILVCQ